MPANVFWVTAHPGRQKDDSLNPKERSELDPEVKNLLALMLDLNSQSNKASK